MGKLYFGDNLKILREKIASESVDLIYLDPPFNSNADYNVLFREKSGEQSQSQIMAFTDTWEWGDESEHTLDDLVRGENVPTNVSEAVKAIVDLIGRNALSAYLVMMAIRLLELKRVLKNTGSIYLHCDPTASHYLKILMDTIFGLKNFRNEIIWRRTGSNNSANRYGPIHQTLLFYTKTDSYYFSYPTGPYTIGYINDFYREKDDSGRYRISMLTGPGIRHGDSGKEWKGYDPTNAGRHWAISDYLRHKYKLVSGRDVSGLTTQEQLDLFDEAGLIYWGKNAKVPNYKMYLDDVPGIPYQDIWAYQPGTKGTVYGNPNVGIDEDVKWLTGTDKEMLGYPTQKPVGLLERIIKASSKGGDVVLDPFCGCGTTVHAAQKMNRDWIGIDITHIAIKLIKNRLLDAFKVTPEVYGEPTDIEGARALALQNRFQFQSWALSLIDARAPPTKVRDHGIDGIINNKKPDGKYYRGYVQVKSGNVGPRDLRDLRGTIERDGTDYGIFLTLNEPTKDMIVEAVQAGFMETVWGEKMLRIQIITIEQLLKGVSPKYPSSSDSYQKAEKEKHRPRKGGEKSRLDFFNETE